MNLSKKIEASLISDDNVKITLSSLILTLNEEISTGYNISSAMRDQIDRLSGGQLMGCVDEKAKEPTNLIGELSSLIYNLSRLNNINETELQRFEKFIG
jgi:hypothetical protein